MLRLINATTPSLVQPRASSHDVTAPSGVVPTRLQPASSVDADLSVEEHISRLVLDCFDNAVNDDARATPCARGVVTQTSVDACDSDSGISDTAPTSLGGDLAAASQCTTPDVEEVVDVVVRRMMFGGRDILDLGHNLRDSTWNLQPTLLPLMNLDMFWKNRSQYHRLGDFGAAETHNEVCCPDCDFLFPVPP